MITDDSNAASVCKVLYSAKTGWSPDAPAELRSRPLFVAYSEPAPKTPYIPRAAKFARTSARAVKERKPAKVKPVAAPRPLKIKREPRRKLAHVNLESIRALQEQGMSSQQIAEKFGCVRATIFKKLRLNRRSSPEASQADAALRICPGCQGPKLAKSKLCAACSKRVNRNEKDAARKRRASSHA